MSTHGSIKSFSITVVGLGKIGLPLAVQFARKGHKVFGADISEDVVACINNGISPIQGEQDLADILKYVVEKNLLVASTQTAEVVAKSNVIVVVVPLLVDKNGQPDFTMLESAIESIAKGLQKNTLVSFETTLPVGTTRNRLVPILEYHSGLKANEDFQVVFSPERVFSGRVFSDLRKYPKLVGGLNKESEIRGIEFYNSVLDFDERNDLSRPNGVWGLEGVETAELVKLAETTYRDVNIALANQFAIFCQSNGLNIETVIEAANSQPFSHIHQPGIAVGGHCIPVYPQLYLLTDPNAILVQAGRNTNNLMPKICVDTLEKEHGSLTGQRVLILGISYRGGVKESAFSGVFPLYDYLKIKGAEVLVEDPLYTDLEISNLGFKPNKHNDSIDAIIIQANHESFVSLGEDLFPSVRTVFDGRNILNKDKWKNTRLVALGKPTS